MSFRKGIGKRSDHRIGVKSTAFQDRNNKNFTTFLKNPIAELEKQKERGRETTWERKRDIYRDIEKQKERGRREERQKGREMESNI